MSQAPGLELQVCAGCGKVQYPDRELCSACLSDDLSIQAVSPEARVLSKTAIHASVEPMFQARAPWTIASLQLAAGPVAIAHLASHDAAIGQTVQLARLQDPEGRSVLVACSKGEAVPTADQFFRNSDS